MSKGIELKMFDFTVLANSWIQVYNRKANNNKLPKSVKN